MRFTTPLPHYVVVLGLYDMVCVFQVLASYINPDSSLPANNTQEASAEDSDSNTSSPPSPSSLPSPVAELLSQSCLVPAISSYLRNDSVLDMARHIPLYHALLLLLRGLATCPLLMPLLLPLDPTQPANSTDTDSSFVSIVALLDKIKTCVDTYASRLK